MEAPIIYAWRKTAARIQPMDQPLILVPRTVGFGPRIKTAGPLGNIGTAIGKGFNFMGNHPKAFMSGGLATAGAGIAAGNEWRSRGMTADHAATMQQGNQALTQAQQQAKAPQPAQPQASNGVTPPAYTAPGTNPAAPQPPAQPTGGTSQPAFDATGAGAKPPAQPGAQGMTTPPQYNAKPAPTPPPGGQPSAPPAPPAAPGAPPAPTMTGGAGPPVQGAATKPQYAPNQPQPAQGGLNGAAQPTAQDVAKAAPPEAKAQGWPGILNWVHEMWNKIPEQMRQPIMAALGIGGAGLLGGLGSQAMGGDFSTGALPMLGLAGGAYAGHRAGMFDQFLPKEYQSSAIYGGSKTPPAGANPTASGQPVAPPTAGGAAGVPGPTGQSGVNAATIGQTPGATGAAVQGFKSMQEAAQDPTASKYFSMGANGTPEANSTAIFSAVGNPQGQQELTQTFMKMPPDVQKQIEQQVAEQANSWNPMASSTAQKLQGLIQQAKSQAPQPGAQQPAAPQPSPADKYQQFSQLPPEQQAAQMRDEIAKETGADPNSVTEGQMRKRVAGMESQFRDAKTRAEIAQQHGLNPNQVTPDMVKGQQVTEDRDRIRQQLAQTRGEKPEEIDENAISRMLQQEQSTRDRSYEEPNTTGEITRGLAGAELQGAAQGGIHAGLRTLGGKLLGKAVGAIPGFNAGMDMADRHGLLPTWAGGEQTGNLNNKLQYDRLKDMGASAQDMRTMWKENLKDNWQRGILPASNESLGDFAGRVGRSALLAGGTALTHAQPFLSAWDRPISTVGGIFDDARKHVAFGRDAVAKQRQTQDAESAQMAARQAQIAANMRQNAAADRAAKGFTTPQANEMYYNRSFDPRLWRKDVSLPIDPRKWFGRAAEDE